MVAKAPTEHMTAQELWDKYAPDDLRDLLALPDDGNEIVTTPAPLFYSRTESDSLVNKIVALFYKPDQKRKAKGKGGGQFEETGAEQKHKTAQDQKNAQAEAEQAAKAAQEATDKLAGTKAQAITSEAAKKVQQQATSAHNAAAANPLSKGQPTFLQSGNVTTTVTPEGKVDPNKSIPDSIGNVVAEQSPGLLITVKPGKGYGDIQLDHETSDGTGTIFVTFPYSGTGGFPLAPAQHVDYLEQMLGAVDNQAQGYRNIGGEDNILVADALRAFGNVKRAELVAAKAGIASAIGAAVGNTSLDKPTAEEDLDAQIAAQVKLLEEMNEAYEFMPLEQQGTSADDKAAAAIEAEEAKLDMLKGMQKLQAKGKLIPVEGTEHLEAGKVPMPYPSNKATTTLNNTPLYLYEQAYEDAYNQLETANQALKAHGSDKFSNAYAITLQQYEEAEKTRDDAYMEVQIARDPDPDSTVGGLTDSLDYIYKKPKTTFSATQAQEFEHKLKLYEAIHGLERPDGALTGWVNAEDYKPGEQMVLSGFVDTEGNVIDAGRFDLGGDTFTSFDGNDQPIQDAYAQWYERISTTQLDSITVYQGTGYEPLNRALREGTGWPGPPEFNREAMIEEWEANEGYGKVPEFNAMAAIKQFQDSEIDRVVAEWADANGYPRKAEPGEDAKSLKKRQAAWDQKNKHGSIPVIMKAQAEYVQKAAEAFQASNADVAIQKMEEWLTAQKGLHEQTQDNLGVDYQKLNDDLDAVFALEGAVAPVNMIVHRRGMLTESEVHVPEGDDILAVGEVAVDPGFVSTSLDLATAMDFEGDYFEIELPKGMPAAYLDAAQDNSENEILLPRNSLFMVKEVREEGEYNTYRLRYLGTSYDPSAPKGNTYTAEGQPPPGQYTEWDAEKGQWNLTSAKQKKLAGFSSTTVSLGGKTITGTGKPPASGDKYAWQAGNLKKTGMVLPLTVEQDARRGDMSLGDQVAGAVLPFYAAASLQAPTVAHFYSDTQLRGRDGRWVETGAEELNRQRRTENRHLDPNALFKKYVNDFDSYVGLVRDFDPKFVNDNIHEPGRKAILAYQNGGHVYLNSMLRKGRDWVNILSAEELAAKYDAEELAKDMEMARANYAGDMIQQVIAEQRKHYIARNQGEYEYMQELFPDGIMAGMDNLDDALSSKGAKAPNNMKVYRAIYGDFLNEPQVGDEYIDPGYVSTSLYPERANNFGDRMNVIEIPEGTPALYLRTISTNLEREHEVLLPRDAILVYMGEEKYVYHTAYSRERRTGMARRWRYLGPKPTANFSDTAEDEEAQDTDKFRWREADLRKTGKTYRIPPYRMPQDAPTATEKPENPLTSRNVPVDQPNPLEGFSVARMLARFGRVDQRRDYYGRWADEGKKKIAQAEQAKKQQEAEAKKLEKQAFTAENVMAQRTGGAAGSNNGGFYKGADGVERYVKIYDDDTQAYSEILANEIYRELGVPVPKADTFTARGTLHYASTIIPGSDIGDQVGTVGLTKERADQILDGFVGDVLTANRDVLGLNFDNVIDVNGKIYRIDNGSSFLHRAQGARKRTEGLDEIGEWESLGPGSGGMNDNYAQVFNTAGYSSPEAMGDKLEKQLRKLKKLWESLGEGGWAAYIERLVPGMDQYDKAAIIRMLESRTRSLVSKTGQARFYRRDQRRDYYGKWVDEGRGRLVAAATITAEPMTKSTRGHGAAYDAMADKYDPKPGEAISTTTPAWTPWTDHATGKPAVPAPATSSPLYTKEDIDAVIAEYSIPDKPRHLMSAYDSGLWGDVLNELRARIEADSASPSSWSEQWEAIAAALRGDKVTPTPTPAAHRGKPVPATVDIPGTHPAGKGETLAVPTGVGPKLGSTKGRSLKELIEAVVSVDAMLPETAEDAMPIKERHVWRKAITELELKGTPEAKAHADAIKDVLAGVETGVSLRERQIREGTWDFYAEASYIHDSFMALPEQERRRLVAGVENLAEDAMYPYINPATTVQLDNERMDPRVAVGIEDLAVRHHMTVPEYVAAATANLKMVVDQSTLSRRTKISTLKKVLADGRVKTQFETGTSSGSYHPEARAAAEYDMFNYPSRYVVDEYGGYAIRDESLPDPTKDIEDAKKRPVYGYLSTRVDQYRSSGGYEGVDSYGDVDLVLKDSVRERTTFVGTDSLGLTEGNGKLAKWSHQLPAPITKPNLRALDWQNTDPLELDFIEGISGSPYTEIQVHGGITLEDIEFVVLPYEPDDDLKVALDNHKMPWILADQSDDIPTLPPGMTFKEYTLSRLAEPKPEPEEPLLDKLKRRIAEGKTTLEETEEERIAAEKLERRRAFGFDKAELEKKWAADDRGEVYRPQEYDPTRGKKAAEPWREPVDLREAAAVARAEAEEAIKKDKERKAYMAEDDTPFSIRVQGDTVRTENLAFFYRKDQRRDKGKFADEGRGRRPAGPQVRQAAAAGVRHTGERLEPVGTSLVDKSDQPTFERKGVRTAGQADPTVKKQITELARMGVCNSPYDMDCMQAMAAKHGFPEVEQILATSTRASWFTTLVDAAPDLQSELGLEYAEDRERVSVNLGITPYRGKPTTEPEDIQAYYNSTRYTGWLTDLRMTAKEHNVKIEDVVKVTGIWQGQVEPSASVWLNGDTESVQKMAKAMGSEYNQEGVMVFSQDQDDGVGAMYTMPGITDRKKAIEAMQQSGVDGARLVTGRDGTYSLEVTDMDGTMFDKVVSLSKRVGTETFYTPGKASLLFGGTDYERRSRPHKGRGYTHASKGANRG